MGSHLTIFPVHRLPMSRLLSVRNNLCRIVFLSCERSLSLSGFHYSFMNLSVAVYLVLPVMRGSDN
ncbi:hypothetical protein ARMSODRAFT_713092 [Armillaria solidipes]|uniref:Uncharacterized protein n=1 Tax=Armillaria solidipes TaxID=1076256 RepID=A0A2H3BQ89_9AGAR|nr:hypothetical protein ARMSODRAFT_713092 [Armillaria solidipes]